MQVSIRFQTTSKSIVLIMKNIEKLLMVTKSSAISMKKSSIYKGENQNKTNSFETADKIQKKKQTNFPDRDRTRDLTHLMPVL